MSDLFFKNLITTHENNCIKIRSYKFCNNVDLICKAILENLYSLRCLLFHGDIDPTDGTNKVFESAYFTLKHILKAIN